MDAVAGRFEDRRTRPGLGSRWILSLAAAAVLVAAVGVTLYVRRAPADDREIAPRATNAANEAVVPSSPTAPIAPASPASPATATPPSADRPSADTRAPAPSRGTPDPGLLAVYLPAAMLRGGQPAVRITPVVHTVRLDIEIESPRPSHVDIALRALPPEGPSEIVWSGERVRVQSEDGQHVASATVPAERLPSGPVEAILTAPGRQWPERRLLFLVRRP